MPLKEDKSEIQQVHRKLKVGFSLAGNLLEAQDESAVIFAAMRSGYELLGAAGCTFVPFSEWKQSLPPLKYGGTAFLNDSDWQERLSAPGTRHTCRVCESRQAGTECVLLQETSSVENVYCVALRHNGREIGMINFYFSALPTIDETQHLFLQEMVRLTDRALDVLLLHAQKIETTIRTNASVEFKKRLSALDAKNKQILEQLEYKAVLDERTRLAREIHDGLAQTLAFLKIEATRMQSFASKGEIDAIAHTLEACHRTLADAYLDTRLVIDNLQRIPDEPLGDWLRMTAVDFQTLTGMDVDLTNIHLDYSFSPTVMAQLTRIVQEALNNVRKHAQSRTVSISAVESGREAIIAIRDNGCGFTPEEVDSAKHYGMRSMRERAESISADFQIISAPGNGTTVRVKIPISEKTTQ